MSRVRVQVQDRPAPIRPNRVDVACFVGFVRRRDSVVPDGLRRWLVERGWFPASARAATFAWSRDDTLTDVPVPIDSWDQFDGLFDWSRSSDDPATGSTWLGAAVRSFFGQGGRRCYVVRVADPISPDVPRTERIEMLARLVPGYPERLLASAEDRASWHGVAHLYGLDDVSFLVLPDLAALLAADPALPELVPPAEPGPAEIFVECSDPQPAPPADDGILDRFAPRLDVAHYAEWHRAVAAVGEFVAGSRLRTTHLLAAVPLPAPGSTAEADIGRFLEIEGYLPVDDGGRADRDEGAFVQFAYPWLQTPGSASLPGHLEPPDGALAGLLARNALTRGTHRDAGGLAAGDVTAVFPVSTAEQSQPDHVASRRLCLFGPTVRGLELLSDVSGSARESQRPGGVGRLVSLLVRAARRVGQDSVFEVSGERLWGQVRSAFERLLTQLHAEGALRGGSPRQAFDVACDRSTMSRNDIDNGRVVARIRVSPAVGIERITVLLAMDDGGRVSAVLSDDREAA